MARFGQDKLEELRNRTDIVELIGAHVRLRRAGRNWVGLCPFHSEKTPSFSVNPERAFFHCFGCGVGGSVFDFVMRIEGGTFPEAVRMLARRAGVSIPEGEEGNSGAGEREAMLQAAEVAAGFFAHVLWRTADGAAAREYLERRGIDAGRAREEFALGFAPMQPASLAKALERRGLLEAGLKIGLVKREGGMHDMFRGRLMFPIRDGQGRALAFGGRVLDDRLPKYINSPESPLYSKSRNLYGLYEARRAIAANERAIVVEGYIDAIALWQAGFRETVASLGTALTVEQLRLLGRYTRNVLACFDGDPAGCKAALRALPLFLEAGLAFGKRVILEPDFDPDRLVRERGAQAFAELLVDSKKTQLLVDYFLDEEAKKAHGSLSARSEAAKRVADMLRRVKDVVEYQELARKAIEFGVGEEVLRSHARPNAERGIPGEWQRFGPMTMRTANAAAQAEIELLAAALAYPELRSEILAALPFVKFDNAAIATLLAEVCESEEEPGALAAFVSQRLSEEQRSLLSALLVTVGSTEQPEVAEEFQIPEFRELDEQKWANTRAYTESGSLAELKRARRVVDDCLKIMKRRGRERETEVLRRAVSSTDSVEAAAALHAVIAHRRGAASES